MKLLFLLLLTACSDPKFPIKKVSIDRCVLECVDSKLYHYGKVDGEAIKEMTKLCAGSLKNTECCTNPFVHNYVNPCDDVL